MHEIVFADADPEAVRRYNHRLREQSPEVEHPASALRPLLPTVEWDAEGVTYGEGVEVSVLFHDEPEDREVQTLMNTLGATALTVRKVEGYD